MKTPSLTDEGLPGWLDPKLVEAVVLNYSLDEVWTVHAYLRKHGGRWIRYRDPKARSTEFSSPARYLVDLWIHDARCEARERMRSPLYNPKELSGYTDDRRERSEYVALFQRLAFEIAVSDDYPTSEELEGYWSLLA